MNDDRIRRLVAGIAAGAAAGAVALALVRSREQRLRLARQVDDLTRWAIERLAWPAASRFVPAGGLQLHAVVAGPEDGPLAVLLHGFPDCWYGWRRQIAALAAAGYRVVVPDQRGYNLSDKPTGVESYGLDRLTGDVMDVIQGLGREQAVVIGHDWGGMVAWRLAMDYPQAVDRLVILNAPHPRAMARELKTNPVQQRRSWYMRFFQLPWLPETLLAFSPQATARLVFRRMTVRPGAFADEDLAVHAAAMAQPGAMAAMIHWYRAAVRCPPARRTQEIAQPTLVLWGEEDPALGKELNNGLEAWVTNLQVHYIADCGHWVQSEAAEEVNSRMLAFLRGTAQRIKS